MNMKIQKQYTFLEYSDDINLIIINKFLVITRNITVKIFIY